MKRLEVSGTVRPIYVSLGVKRLSHYKVYAVPAPTLMGQRKLEWKCKMNNTLAETNIHLV